MTSSRRCLARQAQGFLVAALVLVSVLAACTAGPSGPSTPASAPPAASPISGGSSSDGPSEPGASVGGPGGSGGDQLVVPKPGQLDVHPIAANAFSVRVDGRHVVLTITYTSGVEPCSVLDTIVVQRAARSLAITLREGHGPGNQVCIMIARVMKTQVDLGELDPGTYTISDTTGGAASIQVVVS